MFALRLNSGQKLRYKSREIGLDLNFSKGKEQKLLLLKNHVTANLFEEMELVLYYGSINVNLSPILQDLSCSKIEYFTLARFHIANLDFYSLTQKITELIFFFPKIFSD